VEETEESAGQDAGDGAENGDDGQHQEGANEVVATLWPPSADFFEELSEKFRPHMVFRSVEG
jgi:hypothetical protein